ncbi:MAG TPA: hypothetical protein VEG32_01090 [Clostridia bacterium]|nr:hypothetical protein [Clostridia bacterium]
MILTIDNLDLSGPLDFTRFVDAERPPGVVRRLNAPATMQASLVAAAGSMIRPRAGARIVLRKRDGSALFTGYLDEDAQQEYAGRATDGAVFRYGLRATGDEALLDRKPLPLQMPGCTGSAGAAVRRQTEAACPERFDTSGVEDVASASVGGQPGSGRWSEFVGDVANCARAAYRVEDECVQLRAVGGDVLTLRDADPQFAPEALVLRQPHGVVNDMTVLGEFEPQMYVKDYFIADGHTLRFAMSQQPYLRPSITLLEEEYRELSPALWSMCDPAGALGVSGGRLAVSGGTGSVDETWVALSDPLELGGAISLEHGSVSFEGAGSGVLGGLYAGPVNKAGCIAGFEVVTDASGSRIYALINAARCGTPCSIRAGLRYVLTTRLFTAEAVRLLQPVASSAGAVPPATVGADLRVVLEVHEVDPANPSVPTGAPLVLYDGVLSAAPAVAIYGVVNSADLRCAISYTRIRRTMLAEVRSAEAGAAMRTRLIGGLNDGADCTITSEPAVYFYSGRRPKADELIVVRYRTKGRASARIRDEGSVGQQWRSGFDGVFAATCRIERPTARTSADCERIGSAVLCDSVQQAWEGEYTSWTDLLPRDVRPGDAVRVELNGAGIQFHAVAREVQMEVRDLRSDRARVTIGFANDAAAPIGIAMSPASGEDIPQRTGVNAQSLETLANAEIAEIGSTTVTVDAGSDMVAGRGIEVRREGDFGWGMENDRNLVGRFATRTFSLPRNGRGEDYYLRMYDDSTPPRYSRWTTLLHVDVRYDTV